MMHRGTLVLLAMAAMPAFAQTLEQAAARLAARVASTLPASAPVRFAVENRSSLPASAAERVRAVLDREFKSHPQAADAGSSVSFTISENASGPMIVAELATPETHAVAMERFELPPAEKPGYRARLEVRGVRTQAEPALDFAIAQDRLAVLEPARLAVYRREADGWHSAAEIPIAPAAPLPRDPRGRLAFDGENFDAHLPGTRCAGSLAGGAGCKADGSAWREGPVDVAWVARRNFLTATGVPFFYTGAALDSGAMLIADTEGSIGITGSNITVREKFGGDLAAISTACTTSHAIIVTSQAVDSDMLQAVEVVGSELRPLTERMPLAGPVVAMWAADPPGEVSVVIRNNRSGDYEASRVSLVCDR